jgi:hypothetical protein
VRQVAKRKVRNTGSTKFDLSCSAFDFRLGVFREPCSQAARRGLTQDVQLSEGCAERIEELADPPLRGLTFALTFRLGVGGRQMQRKVA